MLNENSVLTVDDVEPFLQIPIPNIDQDTFEGIYRFRKERAPRLIRIINENMKVLYEMWPDATPIELYYALSENKDSIQGLKAQLASVDTYKQDLRSKLEEMSNPKSQKAKDLELQANSFADQNEEEEDSYDEEDFSVDKKKSLRYRKSKWSEEDRKRFITLINHAEAKNLKSWTHVAKLMPGKNEKTCIYMYNRLKSQGVIRTTFKDHKIHKVKPPKKKSDANHYIPPQFQHIISVAFKFTDQTIIVGPLGQKMKEYAMLNPLNGYIDNITGFPMAVPAISPDYYVLDYYTWLKLINGHQGNTYTTVKIPTKRQLTILTVDNIAEFRDKIVNLEESKPQNKSESS